MTAVSAFDETGAIDKEAYENNHMTATFIGFFVGYSTTSDEAVS